MRCRSLCVAALAAVVALSLPLRADEKKPDKPTANYVHVVVFHAKKDAPKDAVSAAIADCHEMLAGIPSVRGLKVGRPAPGGDPNVPAQKYDFALLVLVDDAAGLKAYLDHPQHKKFVEKHIKNFDIEKLQIFDFADEKK
jgi:hypothetical protein